MVILQSSILRLILLLTIYVANASAQEKNIIIEDNWDQTTDKLAHSTTSFGLYFTLRYFDLTKFEAFTVATIIGFSYDVDQELVVKNWTHKIPSRDPDNITDYN